MVAVSWQLGEKLLQLWRERRYRNGIGQGQAPLKGFQGPILTEMCLLARTVTVFTSS